MQFVNPQFFWALLVPFVVFAFLISTNKDRLSRIFDEKVLKRLSATEESMPLAVRNILMLLALFLMIVAMARPVIIQGDKKVEVQGLTLLSALDISGSMRSTDVYPNRLAFAKKKMQTLFDAMPSDEIGVVAFAYSPFVLAPFTSDKETLKMLVEGVDDSYISMGSTDYDALGEEAKRLLKDKKPKILVLFTDGGDKEAITGFADSMKENGITMYVVLVGTQKGAPVIGEDGKPYMLQDGTIAITQRNDALGELAKENGGAYVVAGTGKKDIEELVSVIRHTYANQQQGEVTVKEQVELFYYPLGLALLFLLIAFSSLPRRKR
ncbi:MAG TPA: VWA domain-containing protein [Sulfurovum sp.]|nr:MAG: VWA domain-containing protein [Sulfurovum sp. 35-42-20]OYY55425.1 MAG: VWA domain-containing protein [Sulfurovum sp. 28-43-6]OYZ26794.1 MAG: VWA domain-containing protein [Sulfurovum sp. 16-42-52]OYZ50547.1 MAG: VWA domain-containing protein [Sulfurovum sp. 24-42-9]OZA46694.1 MAG: VWA domain-containing protein [Sulfurovum sp. 17-42-90]OZA60471.1 MAG: VWA domain-containing protein [Sulfurovum sp. 39-42-12]HQR73173.1 VWA domain-containing protein [Sulfurovum sp.]